VAEKSTIDNRQSAMPRWARELGEETWDKINELLHDGYDTPDILRELNVPAGKMRSLQIYARKFGPRRRLIAFAKFKDAMLQGAVESSADFVQSLGLIAKYAVSPKVPPSKQADAFDLMTKFARMLVRMMASDEKSQSVETQETDVAPLTAQEMVDRVRDVYGVPRS
jgi:hypothetical protein